MGGMQLLLLAALLGSAQPRSSFRLLGPPPRGGGGGGGGGWGEGGVGEASRPWGGGRPPCRPLNVTVALEKEECPQCRAVTATACAGYCRTREPVYRSPLGAPPQASCSYLGVRYERWALGGCPPGVDPTVTLPVALGCRCGSCPMAATDCTVLALGPAFCGAPGGFGAGGGPAGLGGPGGGS